MARRGTEQKKGLRGYEKDNGELTTCGHCGFGHTEYYILKGRNGEGAFKSMRIGETCLRFNVATIMGMSIENHRGRS